MKDLISSFFHKNNEYAYVLSAYHPIEIRNTSETETYTVHLLKPTKQSDEMSIDNIYQSS